MKWLRKNWENSENGFKKVLKKCSEMWATNKYVSSSTETVAFQVYEILKIDHEFLQIF